MRIERIDLDGFEGLSGKFEFPADGLAVWGAPSGAGKTRLWRAVVAAFYGAPNTDSGWILLRFVRDDGSSYTLARDLAADRVEITDTRGEDVTPQFVRGSAPIGFTVFGLTEAEFSAATRISAAELQGTVGHPDLLSAIGSRPVGRESASLAGGTAPPAAVPPPADTVEPDLEIFRSPAEEMGFLSAPGGAVEQPLDFEIETVADAGPSALPPPPPLPLDPEEPGLAATERQRRLKLALKALEARLVRKKRDLVALSDRLHEMQSETARLASLREAEPRDIEALGDLLRRLAGLEAERDALASQDAEYRASLESAGVRVRDLESQTQSFSALPEEELAFLASFRQAEAVRRGNQALIRSECRLDESKLAEVAAAQERLARLAIGPLAAAVASLFASIALGLFAVPFPPAIPFAVGFLAALGGGLLLWRGRHHRADERTRLTEGQERKRAQLQQLEDEEAGTAQRIAKLAAKCGAHDAAALLECYDAWTARSRERQELERLAGAASDVQKDWISAREELGRFAAANSRGDFTDANLFDADAIHRDYVRFFELRGIVAEGERKSSDLEDDLIALETERAELRQALEDLTAELAPQPAADAGDPGPVPAAPSPRPPAPGGTVPGEAPRGIEMDWSPTLSARAEAILRRILPEVRDVEIDGGLSPQLRFDRRTLPFAELPGRLTGASIDQVCLALRLAIVETVSSSRERLPVFLDDPLTRADDARHDRALQFLVEDASVRSQVILLTAQEVRAKWFLHQHPEHRDRFRTIAQAPAGSTAAPGGDATSRLAPRGAATASPSVSSPSS